MHKLTIVAVSLSLIACGSSYKDEPPTSGSSVSSQTPSSGTSSGGKGGSGDQVASGKGDDAGAAATGKGGADTSGKGSADPDCLTTCEMTMVAKCGGDTTVCDDVCALTPTQIACLEDAPTCDKTVWVTCLGGDDAGAGAGKGGGK
jgi:hypothetical protein